MSKAQQIPVLFTQASTALQLADDLEYAAGDYDAWDKRLGYGAADELRRQHKVIEELLEALKLAVCQNEHDMLMTGEELRNARAAISRAEQA